MIKRNSVVVVLCAAVLCACAAAAEKGLVAHYTFDEGSGSVVKDRSGNGHDGAIKGAVYVKSPRGYALRFDGVDDVVDFGADDGMIVEGSLTLMVWLKTDSADAPTTHRVIFGDSAGTINRNLNLRIDYRNKLCFEWGNGSKHGFMTADSGVLDGTWRHLALVCDWEARLITLYVDAQPFAQKEMPIPVSKTAIGKRFIGAWGYGCFKGDIDDIRLYDRALSESEIERIYTSETGGAGARPRPAGDSIKVLRTARIEGKAADVKAGTFEVGPAFAVLDPSAERPQAVLCVPIMNRTGGPRKARVVLWRDGAGAECAGAKTIELPRDGLVEVFFDRLEMKPLFSKRTDFYIGRSRPGGLRVAVSAPGSPEIRSRVLVVDIAPYCEPLRIEVEDPWRSDLEPGKTKHIVLTVRARILERHLEKGELIIELRSREGGGPAVTRRIKGPGRVTRVRLDTKDIPWGAYDARVAWNDASGREVVAATALAVVLPGGEERLVPLNNLVTELMNAKVRGLLSRKEISFMNPRDGWCFFSASGEVTVRLDAADRPLLAARAGGKPAEAMRLLPAGKHTLRVEGRPSQLVVRAVPALIYNVHEARPLIAAFGVHTWERVNRTILPQCNMIESCREYPKEMAEWHAAGKLWVTHVQTPGLLDRTYSVSAEQAYDCWKKNLGYTSPLADGMQADEVVPGYTAESLQAFAESVGRLHDDPKFAGRMFIPFVVRIHEYPGGMLFMKSLFAAGWPFSIELYLPEQPTEELNRKNIREHLIARALAWEDALPGSLRRAVITPMYSMMPYCTTNVCPTVDFKVHLDMQLHALATAPRLFGLYGVQPYRSNYTDEETLRWMGKLLRHYCIEGRTERLWKDPYLLAHIEDPDFEEGLAHWQALPAEEGGITARTVKGYGLLQGRYLGGTRGDTVAILKRSAKGPNVLSQKIRNLVPGRVYSVKMITADYDDLMQRRSRKATNAVAIRIDGAEVLEGSFQYTYRNAMGPSCFRGKSRFWMNYHYLRFRAKGDTARLVISDWKDEKNPGGPVGQETMLNDIEIQPFVEE